MEKCLPKEGVDPLSRRIYYEKEFFDKRALDLLELWDYDLRLRKDYSRSLQFLGVNLKSLKDKKVLDCGCGLGELSVWLAMHNVHVCAIDVSPKSLEVLKKRAELYKVHDKIQAQLMAIENLGYKEESFDLVVGEWILHHVLIDKSVPEIYRVLKRGGKAIFLETNANNKLLLFCRRFIVGRLGIPKYQDEVEYPLTDEDIQKIKRIFAGNCKCHYPFTFFKLLDNYIFHAKIKFISFILAHLDRSVYRFFPSLRKYSYHQVIELSKV